MAILAAACSALSAGAADSSASAASAPAAAASGRPAQWIAVTRDTGRLSAADIGLVINTADPYSVEVGEYYIERRHLKPAQVLRVDLPAQPALTAEEFERLKARIEEHFGPRTQALALAWTTPYLVQCHAITGALALGLDPQLCQHTCKHTRESSYFNAPDPRPWSAHGMRLSMLLAAGSVEQAKALIDRGVAADRTLGLHGAPPVQAIFVSTADTLRSVRASLFPPAGPLRRLNVEVQREQADTAADKPRLLLYETGAVKVDHLSSFHWVDGALADHLTSFGGLLDKSNGQMSALAWLDSGATASYGTVSEPCNHQQKFPHPQLLLQHYLQGDTAIEAYWKSVAWPQQGLFIGEPLAAPFARR